MNERLKKMRKREMKATLKKMSMFMLFIYALNHFNLTYDCEHQQVFKIRGVNRTSEGKKTILCARTSRNQN